MINFLRKCQRQYEAKYQAENGNDLEGDCLDGLVDSSGLGRQNED